MKKLTLFLLISYCLVTHVFAQSSGSALPINARPNKTRSVQTAGVPDSISNKLSAKHLYMPFTRLYLVPPPGFKLSTSSSILRKDEFGLSVSDMPGDNFYNKLTELREEQFEQDKIEVYFYKTLTINGLVSKLICFKLDETTRGYMLAFGDADFSVIIMGNYRASDKEAEENMKASLLSVIYDKALDRFAASPFTLDDRESKFKFVKVFSDTYFYGLKGTDPSEDDTQLLAMMLPGEFHSDTRYMKKLIEQSFGKKGIKGKLKFQNHSSVSINGYQAYETEIYGTIFGVQKALYVLVVGRRDHVITIMGITRSDFETNIAEFRKLAHTVKLK